MRWENSNCRESIWCCCRKGLPRTRGWALLCDRTRGTPGHQHRAGRAPQHLGRAARAGSIPLAPPWELLQPPSSIPSRRIILSILRILRISLSRQGMGTGELAGGCRRDPATAMEHTGETSREPQSVSHGDPAGALPGGSCCMEKCQHFRAQEDG